MAGTIHNIIMAKTKKTSAKKQTEKKKATKPVSNQPVLNVKPAWELIEEYFERECKIDPVFAAKYRSGDKTAKDAYKYLYELYRAYAKQHGNAVATDNDNDNRIAKQFVMDDSLKKKPDYIKGGKKPQPEVPSEPADDADMDLDDLDSLDKPATVTEASPSVSTKPKTPTKPKTKPTTKPSEPAKPQPKPSAPAKPQPKQYTILDDFDF